MSTPGSRLDEFDWSRGLPLKAVSELIPIECDQDTDEWMEERLSCVSTGSMIGPACGIGSISRRQTMKALIDPSHREKQQRWFETFPPVIFGKEHEDDGIAFAWKHLWNEERTYRKDPIGFYKRRVLYTMESKHREEPEISNLDFGFSPDDVNWDEGVLLEIKCPKEGASVHEHPKPEWIAQVMYGMWVLGLKESVIVQWSYTQASVHTVRYSPVVMHWLLCNLWEFWNIPGLDGLKFRHGKKKARLLFFSEIVKSFVQLSKFFIINEGHEKLLVELPPQPNCDSGSE